MNNKDFLAAVTKSFHAFLIKGTSRSTDKIVPLHGAIAADLAKRLGPDYHIWSKGYGEGKEAQMDGRYYGKAVDITIMRGDEPVAGIAVKFVMQNYAQNSVNYFENMLGETANIRCNNHPYFQLFVILDKLPYYKKGTKSIMRWETFTSHNAEKYQALSLDNNERYMHTPNKTALCVVHLPDAKPVPTTQEEYLSYYRRHLPKLTFSTHDYPEFGPNVLLNDYETFINKVFHSVMAL